MPDLLVTGTDTGVGKTVLAAAIVIALRERRVRAIGFKPAESGEGIVLRCFNALESAVEGAILLGSPARSAARVRADESHPIPLPLERGGRSIPFRAEPRAILSFHLQPA